MQAAERQRERLESDIAVLKAERAYLARPGAHRARRQGTGHAPADGWQHIELDALVGGGAAVPAERAEVMPPVSIAMSRWQQARRPRPARGRARRARAC